MVTKMLLLALGVYFMVFLPLFIVRTLKGAEVNHVRALKFVGDIGIWFVALPLAAMTGIMLYPELALPRKDWFDWTVGIMTLGYGLVFTSIALAIAVIAHAAKVYGGHEKMKVTLRAIRFACIGTSLWVILSMTSTATDILKAFFAGGQFVPFEMYMRIVSTGLVAIICNPLYTILWLNIGRKTANLS